MTSHTKMHCPTWCNTPGHVSSVDLHAVDMNVRWVNGCPLVDTPVSRQTYSPVGYSRGSHGRPLCDTLVLRKMESHAGFFLGAHGCPLVGTLAQLDLMWITCMCVGWIPCLAWKSPVGSSPGRSERYPIIVTWYLWSRFISYEFIVVLVQQYALLLLYLPLSPRRANLFLSFFAYEMSGRLKHSFAR